MANLDINPDTRMQNRKFQDKKKKKVHGKLPTEQPAPGIDDEVAFNLTGRASRHESLSKFKEPATIESVIFHELAEAYERIEHNKQYAEAQQEDVRREQKLRNERPYLTDHNPGSGPGDKVIKK
jgi:hypothetical protein